MSWPKTVRKSDLRIDYYRGTGKGGQHKNKTDSACRITHLPTGIVAQAEDERDQRRNKKIAFRRLTEKLIPLMREAAREELPKPVTDRIRTYHEPRQKVKDHRTGKSYSFSDVLEGKGLDDIFRDLLDAEMELSS